MSVAILGSLLRTAVPGIGSWCVAHALLATASACVLIAGSLQARFVTLAAALITLTAVLLLIQGMRQFFGEAWAVPQETGAFAVAFAALVYFTLVSPNVSAKIGIVSVFFAYARIAVGTLALRHAPHDGTRYPYRFVAAAAY
ncbi:hypothetical protein NQ024_12860, partial [Corynebacterium sp. 35RC1]|nr:hypothetical protein [Corynebacterium sp. 35RC1]